MFFNIKIDHFNIAPSHFYSLHIIIYIAIVKTFPSIFITFVKFIRIIMAYTHISAQAHSSSRKSTQLGK